MSTIRDVKGFLTFWKRCEKTFLGAKLLPSRFPTFAWLSKNASKTGSLFIQCSWSCSNRKNWTMICVTAFSYKNSSSESNSVKRKYRSYVSTRSVNPRIFQTFHTRLSWNSLLSGYFSGSSGCEHLGEGGSAEEAPARTSFGYPRLGTEAERDVLKRETRAILRQSRTIVSRGSLDHEHQWRAQVSHDSSHVWRECWAGIKLCSVDRWTNRNEDSSYTLHRMVPSLLFWPKTPSESCETKGLEK